MSDIKINIENLQINHQAPPNDDFIESHEPAKGPLIAIIIMALICALLACMPYMGGLIGAIADIGAFVIWGTVGVLSVAIFGVAGKLMYAGYWNHKERHAEFIREQKKQDILAMAEINQKMMEYNIPEGQIIRRAHHDD